MKMKRGFMFNDPNFPIDGTERMRMVEATEGRMKIEELEKKAYADLQAAIAAGGKEAIARALKHAFLREQLRLAGMAERGAMRNAEACGVWNAEADRDMTESEIREAACQIVKAFTDARQVAVWNLYALGGTQRSIAAELKCSVGTVNTELKALEDAGLLRIRKRGGAAGEAFTKGGKARNTTHRD